jgi:hypothetical protein
LCNESEFYWRGLLEGRAKKTRTGDLGAEHAQPRKTEEAGKPERLGERKDLKLEILTWT